MLGTVGMSLFIPAPSEDNELAFQYMTGDSVLLDVNKYYNPEGILEGYRSHIITPVCEDRTCYDVELDFYWDVLGNFMRFDVDPKNPLTKLDHVPFTSGDYEKLRGILAKTNPSFVYLKRNQLVIDDPEHGNNVDGVSSATVSSVKEDMVEGAIYTCYTLWQIANKTIKFKIKQHTRNHLDVALVRKMLKSAKVDQHYFVIENMDGAMYENFIPEIIRLASQYNGFFITRVMKHMPQDMFQRREVVVFLVGKMNALALQDQVFLLSKINETDNNVWVLHALVANIHDMGTMARNQAIALVCDQTQASNLEAFKDMVSLLNDYFDEIPPLLFSKIISTGNNYPTLERTMKKINRDYQKANR
ncbi:MAG: hypothetical protein RIG77_19135 [Cyclobacteriaceae bacterium]